MEVVYFINSYERTNVMLDRYSLDEFTPRERVSILLDSGSHLEKSDLDFLTEEVSSIKERKYLATLLIQHANISLSEGARKFLDAILAQE